MDIAWLNRSSIGAALETMGCGVVPLIDPESERRRVRGETVIRWYAARTGIEALAPRPALSAGGKVVAASAEAAGAAAFYATLEGLPITRCCDLASALEVIQTVRPNEPVVIFASRDKLGVRALQRLRRSERSALGIITGYDAAAMHFMAVKTAIWSRWAAGHPMRDQSLLLDEIGGRVTARHGVDCPAEQSFSADVIRGAVDGDHDLILMHVHGEGSHANLRETVLCGVTFERETVEGQPLDSSCEIGPEERKCKRVHSSHISIRGFEELRAAEVALFSCNGFAVSGELYPSASSCVLSMADGYVARILCNDRAVPLTSATVDLAHGLVAQGASLADLAEELNAVARFKSESCPWLIVGHPARGTLDWSELDPADGFACNERLTTLTLPSHLGGVKRTLMPIYKTGYPAVEILRGAGRVVLSRVARPNDEPLEGRIAVARETAEGTERWLQVAHSACARVTQLELGVERVYGDRAAKHAPLAKLFDELHQLRVLIERSLGLVAFELNRVRETGWVTDAFHCCLNHSRATVSVWDRAFASLVANNLSTGSFEACFREGYLFHRRSEGHACSRCGSPLLVEEMLPASGYGSAREWTSCIVCGPQGCMDRDGFEFEVEVPSRVCAGQTIIVRAHM